MLFWRNRFASIAGVFAISCIISFIVTGCQGNGNPTSNDLTGSGIEPGTLESIGLLQTEMKDGRLIDIAGPSPGSQYIGDEVLVVLNEPYDDEVTDSILDNLPLRLARVIPCRWGTIFELIITDGTPVPDMVEIIKRDSRVRIAEPNFILPFDEIPYWPNDPMWESDDAGNDPRDSVFDMWGPSKLGADIVWNESNGSEDVIVAILDTGIMYNHEDLNDNIWINEDEIPDNSIDDDENGWVDDWWGWNCWQDNNYPNDDGAYASYHGTSCAGVTAAVQDNDRGLCGVAPGIKLMALKVDLTGAGGLVSTVCLAFEYARANDADICSMSFGTSSYSEILEIACDDAWDNGNGVILMASSGNNNSTNILYPSRYASVMTIGATIPWTSSYQPRDEARISSQIGYYWGSSYGDQLTVMGFGDQYMTTYGSHYAAYRDGVSAGFFNGTSCACPMSAGVMALIKSYFPAQDPQWCWDRLKDTADDLNVPGFDIQTGYGRCNALRAVYGSDRYSDQEDLLGFVPLTFPDVQVFDSIHWWPGNPYDDEQDLYRFTTTKEGYLIVDLDIFTWGEDLGIALYSDQAMSNLVQMSDVENHYDNSFESIIISVEAGVEYFFKVFAPEIGDSTTYGLRVHNASNELVVSGTSITPPFVHQQGTDVPFLKLSVEIGYQATLDELIINKSGTLPNNNWSNVSLYEDTNGDDEFDDGDQLLDQISPAGMNRVVFDELGLEWTWEDPMVLFVTSDISETLEDCTMVLSLESYKDVSTEEGFSTTYEGFPIRSDELPIGTDIDPPVWDTTVGAQLAEPYFTSAIIGWNNATDWQTPPVKYNIYYTDTLPFDIGNATPVLDVSYEGGSTTDYETIIWDLPIGFEWYFVVRAEDSVGNEDENLEMVSCIPLEGGDPTNPILLKSFQTISDALCVELKGNILLVGLENYGMFVYDRTSPVNIENIGFWSSGSVYDIVFDGTYAWTGGYSYLSAIDLSDPTDPLMLDYTSYSRSVTVGKVNDWLYVGSSYYDNLMPVKVIDPSNLDLYPTVDLSWAGDSVDIDFYSNYMFVTCSGKGVLALSITYPGFPSMINVFGSSGSTAMHVEGDVLFVADSSTGAITSYDLTTDPANPDVLGTCTDGPGSGAVEMVMVDDYLYVAESTYGIVVYSVGNPADMQHVGDLVMVGINDIATDGQYIYAITDLGVRVVI